MFNVSQTDSDGDEVGNGCDACPKTVAAAPVDEVGCPAKIPGDFERDGDVDADDLEHLRGCSTGPTVRQSDPTCWNADLDADGDVDQSDFGLFQRCMSGANLPADPSCAY